MTWVIAGFATAGALIDDNPIEGALKGAALAYTGGQLLGPAAAGTAGTTASTAAGTAVPTAATGAGATSTGLLAPTTASSATAAAAEQAATAATTTNASMLADPYGVDATLMQNPVRDLATPSTATSVNPGTSLTQQGFESNLLQNNPNIPTKPGFKQKLQMGLLQQAPAFLPKDQPQPAPASSGPSLRVPSIAGPENLYLRFNRRKR
jgi:hypothetical protein